MSLIARETLQKSRFFVSKARDTTLEQRQEFATFLEAAIVFSRSVTFHLQKELAENPRFDPWYQSWQHRLGASAISRYLLDQRNYVLKEGPLETRRVISMMGTSSIRLRDSVTVTVHRGTPWYRRSLAIIVEDLLRPYREWKRHRLDQLQQKVEARRARKAAKAAARAAVTSDAIYFADEEWSGTPAIDLVEQHLSLLDELVTEAEAVFASARGNAA